MKFYFSLALTFLLFSCNTVKYISKPVRQSPNIGSHYIKGRVLIAKDVRINLLDYNSDRCIDGLTSYVINNTSIKVIDKIKFNQKVDSTILMELKTKYNVDGLLLLTDIYVGEFAFDEVVQGPGIFYPYSKKYFFVRVNLWFNINTRWEYYNFNNGLTYLYYASNEKSFRLKYELEDVEDMGEDIFLLRDEALLNNGSISSKNLIGY